MTILFVQNNPFYYKNISQFRRNSRRLKEIINGNVLNFWYIIFFLCTYDLVAIFSIFVRMCNLLNDTLHLNPNNGASGFTKEVLRNGDALKDKNNNRVNEG